MKKAGLYIHIPFCEKRCAYCNFVSCGGASEEFIDSYVSALCLEAHSCKYRAISFDTVFLGGGTPSFISQKHIKKIISAVRDNFCLQADAEITIEANPNTFSKEKLSAYLGCGFNRFSIGLQSANDRVLRAAGRLHTRQDFISAISLLKQNGVKNISADIMLGLPLQTIADIENTLLLLDELEIPHISAYGLKLEKGTPLYKMVENGEAVLPDEDTAADMYALTLNFLRARGIERYEVSNFAKAGFECRHNINYWRRGEYLGLGAAAHSFMGGARFSNTEDVGEYIRLIRDKGQAYKEIEKISPPDAEFEYIMLNLRLSRGINTGEFRKLFAAEFTRKYAPQLKKLSGFIECGENFAKATDKGFAVLNSVLTEFLP